MSEIAAEGVRDEEPADEAATREVLLAGSGRRAAPLPSMFVQNPDRSASPREAPLASFVRNGDLRGLRAFLFLHSFISSGENGWSRALYLPVWARVFDATVTATPTAAATAASKILTRLEARNLIARGRDERSRRVKVTLLRADGSGAEYTRPDGRDDKFLSLSFAFWRDGLYRALDMPATAMLLVALHEKPGFELASERVPEWYGWSADTAERGFASLRDLGHLRVSQRLKQAPLAPTGATLVNAYTVVGPLAGSRKALASSTIGADGLDDEDEVRA